MDVALGIVGKDFVMMCTDMSNVRSVFNYKVDEAKLVNVDPSKVLAVTGDHSSRSQLAEFVRAKMSLHFIESGSPLNNHASANWLRAHIAKALRSRAPVQCNVLLGGVDAKGPSLHYFDYLGSMQKVDYTAHG